MYPTLKIIHMSLAGISVAGFVARALPALARDRLAARRWLRTAPHVVDTLLLATGVWLAVLAGWRPLAHPWLGWKLYWLVVYIVLGLFAMRVTLPRGVRVAAFVAALVVIAQLIATAITKSPWGLLA